VRGEEQTKQADQGHGDEHLWRDARLITVDVGASRPACWAAAFHHGTRAVRANQVLATHLIAFLAKLPPDALGVIWSLGRLFPPKLFPG
jgi:hypothetical protein